MGDVVKMDEEKTFGPNFIINLFIIFFSLQNGTKFQFAKICICYLNMIRQIVNVVALCK